MAEKKGIGHAYNVDFLNVVFAASSLFLFLSVIWMVWDDYDREWKNTQRRFAQLEYTVTQEQLNAAARAVDRNKLQQFEGEQKAAQQNVSANQAKVAELQGKLAAVETRLYRATLDYQYAKANYDENRYSFEAARAAGSSNASREQSVSAEGKRVADLNLDVEKALAEKAELQKQLGDFTGKLADVQKQIGEITAEQSRLRKRLGVVAPSLVKDYFRNAPLLDFMAPTIKIQQIILPNVV